MKKWFIKNFSTINWIIVVVLIATALFEFVTGNSGLGIVFLTIAYILKLI